MARLCSQWPCTKFMDQSHYAESCQFHLGIFCDINDSLTISPTLLYGQSNWLAGEVWMALSLGHCLNKLYNHHTRHPGFFLDPHCKHWKINCQCQHVMTHFVSYPANLLLFCNQIITHINHAESHSNT